MRHPWLQPNIAHTIWIFGKQLDTFNRSTFFINFNQDIPAYFHGQSRLNNSIFGWTGHTLEADTFLSRLGIYPR